MDTFTKPVIASTSTQNINPITGRLSQKLFRYKFFGSKPHSLSTDPKVHEPYPHPMLWSLDLSEVQNRKAIEKRNSDINTKLYVEYFSNYTKFHSLKISICMLPKILCLDGLIWMFCSFGLCHIEAKSFVNYLYALTVFVMTDLASLYVTFFHPSLSFFLLSFFPLMIRRPKILQL